MGDVRTITFSAIEKHICEPIGVEIPYYGFKRLSGKAYALDQYAIREGYNRYAEWFSEFTKDGTHILGLVQESDDIMLMDNGVTMPATFGYDLYLQFMAIPDHMRTETCSISHEGALLGLPTVVRNGVLLDKFARSKGCASFSLWAAQMGEQNTLTGSKIIQNSHEDGPTVPSSAALSAVSYDVIVSTMRIVDL